jgi:hypothetical protein
VTPRPRKNKDPARAGHPRILLFNRRVAAGMLRLNQAVRLTAVSQALRPAIPYPVRARGQENMLPWMECLYLARSTKRLTVLPLTWVVAVASEWQARQSWSLIFCAAEGIAAQKKTDATKNSVKNRLAGFTGSRRRLWGACCRDRNHMEGRRGSQWSGLASRQVSKSASSGASWHHFFWLS